MDLLSKKTWKFNQNFSLLHLHNENHVDEIAESSLFHGTIVEKNYWENVKIDNSDLEAMRIVHTIIKNSSFKNSDMHSLLVTRTEFSNTSFQETDISDCTFIECKFINCDFSNATLKENQFEDCIFDSPVFSGGSYIMNSFINSTLTNTCLKNVFYYTYFKECTFEEVIMEAYLLGYSFGLTLNNLEELSYLFMGELCSDDYQKVCKDINNVYIDRRMVINSGLLYLVDPKVPVEKAIIKCFECVYYYIKENHLIQKEQMVFLNKIVTIMHEEQTISPLTVICLINSINHTLNLERNSSLAKAEQGLLSIKNSMLTYYYHFIDELQKYLAEIPHNCDMELKITYEERPSYRLANIVKDIDPEKEINVIKTESGSFIEWIECSSTILPYIDTFLALLGVAIPVIFETQKNRKKKKDPQSSNCVIQITNKIEVSQITSKELDVLPEIIQKSVDPILQRDINKTITFVLNNNFIQANDCHGYSKKNVRSIEAKKRRKKH